jgi:hypothetical protein
MQQKLISSLVLVTLLLTVALTAKAYLMPANGRSWPFAVCEISLIQQNRTTANDESSRSDFGV